MSWMSHKAHNWKRYHFFFDFLHIFPVKIVCKFHFQNVTTDFYLSIDRVHTYFKLKVVYKCGGFMVPNRIEIGVFRWNGNHTRSILFQFQSLTNIPCGLESNNNIATGVSVDEEDVSAEDDEHIRRSLSSTDGRVSLRDAKPAVKVMATNGISSPSLPGVEKLRIDYPKKYRSVRSMSLSIERSSFNDLCPGFCGSVSFDLGGGSVAGGGGSVSGGGGSVGGRDDWADDKSARRYFGFTFRQYMALASLALVDFLGFCSMSVMAPTFPKEVTACRPSALFRNFSRLR